MTTAEQRITQQRYRRWADTMELGVRALEGLRAENTSQHEATKRIKSRTQTANYRRVRS